MNGFYDDVTRVSSALLPRVRVSFEFARALQPRTALDLGAGDGENSSALAATTGARVVCVDVSEKAVQACRARGLEAHQVAIGETDLPFEAGTFDLVVMAEVVEHLAQPDKAMEEIRRVLRPGGHLILSTPNLACLPNRALLLLGVQPLFSEVSTRSVLGRRLGVLGQGGRPVGHLRLYTKRALLEFLGLSGFADIRLRGVRMHRAGALAVLEGLASVWPGWAMLFVVQAQKPI